MPPKNWPPHLPYLTTPSYSPNLTPTHLTALRTRPPSIPSIPSQTPRGHSPLVKITPISTPSHPACGQSGLFATKDLKPGTFILEYIGVIHGTPLPKSDDLAMDLPAGGTEPQKTEPEPEPETSPPKPKPQPQTQPSPPDPHAHSNYDLSLDRHSGLGIDAASSGNEARFINDYRGVASKPNAEFKDVWDERRKERGVGVWVLPEGKSMKGKGKGVRKGEEILVSYGRGFWGARREE